LKQEIISTLANMWYQKQEIEKALSKINPELKNIQEIIPALIKEL
jgi:Holliday junction resolvasome RuvABC DNA-binding subunit